MAQSPCLGRGGPRPGPPHPGQSCFWSASALLVLFLAALAGCDGSRSPSPTRTPGSSPAQRIASLSPSLTETLFRLGAGSRVVGVGRFCDRPPEAGTRPVVGDSVSVYLERLVAVEPDLIILDTDHPDDSVERLRVPVLRVPLRALDDVFRTIVALGKEVGASGEADRLVRQLQSALRSARVRTAGRVRERVLVVIARDPFIVAGPDTYLSGLLEALGYENACRGFSDPWPSLSLETVITLDPDVLVDATLAPLTPLDRRQSEAASYWSRFPVFRPVREGRVRAIRDELPLRPGPAIPEALTSLEESVAPRPPPGTALRNPK